jgi:type I restriction enzyme S subunit
MNKKRAKTLREYIDIKHGFAFSSDFYAESGNYVLLTPGNFQEEGGFRWLGEKQKYYSGEIPEDYILSAGQMLIAMTEQAPGLLGSTFFVPNDLIYLHNQRLGLITIKDPQKLDAKYLHYFFSSSPVRAQISKESAGTKVKHTSPEKLLRIHLEPLSFKAQQKIAAILQTWDEAIDKLDSLSRKLERLNTALRLKYFEKQFAREKSVTKASRIFEPVSERARPDLPLLAVMQDLGVVRRDELDRRVAMPDGDTSSYKVVRPGDFVISLRSFEGGLEYSNELGLVSPAYTVLRPIREINSDYYRHFFKSRSFIGRLDKLIFGIRDGKQIAFRDFGDMRIPNPSIKVQESDAAALNQAASLLELNQKRKQSLEKQKRGLMQKLLTGEWRVKC